MTRINRAAWQRIKGRLANPDPNADLATSLAASIRTVNAAKAGYERGRSGEATFFKGRSVGATQSMLENIQPHIRELMAHKATKLIVNR